MLGLRKPQQGFTMLELVIAIAIFGIVISGLAAGIQNLIVLNNRSRDLALTNLLAESKSEQLRSAGFNSLSTGTDDYTVDFTDELPPQLASPKTASYTVSNPTPGVIEVVISISYKDYHTTRQQNYKTIISELGVGQ